MEKVKASFRNRWFVLSIVLAACLSTLVGYNIYQNFHYNNRRHFTFAWSPREQLIADGETLWINMTTWWDNENFYATVRTNDYNPNGTRELGIVFDKDHDWKITSERGYVMSFGNYCVGGHVYFGLVELGTPSYYPSPYHVHSFSNVTGHQFQIKFPKTEIGVDSPTLIHVSYRRFPVYWNETGDVLLGPVADYLLSFVSFEVVA